MTPAIMDGKQTQHILKNSADKEINSNCVRPTEPRSGLDTAARGLPPLGCGQQGFVIDLGVDVGNGAGFAFDVCGGLAGLGSVEGAVVGSGARPNGLSGYLEVSFKQCLFSGLTPNLVAAVLASSRASPLPQVSAVTKGFVNDTDHCGSGLARDEARKNTVQLSVKPLDK
ncbi:hypothetical protein [Pseudomonas sp. BF-R-26]|uniref:hypothetical protein n=1 Tax=Pseudomonas sp. BF-R-26 TaxID=2832398 RepID=UPI001CBBCA16|nr:hypothetical protein [Pseudomonas sp. BF-R-26]